MKLKLSLDNPLNRAQRIAKTFDLPKSTTKLVKQLMAKIDKGGMIILPVEVVAEYGDRSQESTTIFISTLCEGHNKRINNLTSPEVVSNVIVNESKKENKKRSLIQIIKSVFRRKNDGRRAISYN